MLLLKILAYIIVALYLVLVVVFYFLQTRLIFYPGKLAKDYQFKLGALGEEVFLNTSDGERIHGLYFYGVKSDVILYFHGNAGDLSGWKFVAQDFTTVGYNVLLIDYRGYGKSSGAISEEGLYKDAAAAYSFLVKDKGYSPANIIIYGRSIGSGVAVDLASEQRCKGLVLESPYSSLATLANEKIPFFFPSLYLRYSFNNLQKIEQVRCPVIFLHGAADELIPATHTERLFNKFSGKKTKLIIPKGTHNDLNSFEEYNHFLTQVLPRVFLK
jgi:fermentation-respiration switch protein FrsA (DUF1100 family)